MDKNTFRDDQKEMDVIDASTQITATTSKNVVIKADPTNTQSINRANSKFENFSSNNDEVKVVKMKDYWRQKSMMSPRYSPPAFSTGGKQREMWYKRKTLSLPDISAADFATDLEKNLSQTPPCEGETVQKGSSSLDNTEIYKRKHSLMLDLSLIHI